MEHANPGWHHYAACRGHEQPELWFPFDSVEDVSEPVGICRRCPVRDECARTALETATSDGIFGGYRLPAEREKLKAAYGYVQKPAPKRERTKRTAVCACGVTFNGDNDSQCWGCRKGWVRTTAARTHIWKCVAAGGTHGAIARAAGGDITVGVVAQIAAGNTVHMRPDRAEALLALDPQMFASVVVS